jgi:hypothetical protein
MRIAAMASWRHRETAFLVVEIRVDAGHRVMAPFQTKLSMDFAPFSQVVS